MNTECKYALSPAYIAGIYYMCENSKELIKKRIISLLNRNSYFVCEQCFIRGSFTGESWQVDSDIDLLVISGDFEGISYSKRISLVELALSKLATKIDPICLSSNEYERVISERRVRYFDEELIRIV